MSQMYLHLDTSYQSPPKPPRCEPIWLADLWLFKPDVKNRQKRQFFEVEIEK